MKILFKNQKMRAFALSLIFLCASTLSFAENGLTLFGLNFSIPIGERVKSVSARGYTCDNKWGEYICKRNGSDGEILISEKKIKFSCSVFNICEYGLDEVSKILVEQGIVRAMKYDWDPSRSIHSYCSRGEMGDRLCAVREDLVTDRGRFVGKGKVQLILNKDAFGTSRPTFR